MVSYFRFLAVLTMDSGRIQRAGRGEKMAEALELEKVDEHGKPIKRLAAHPPRKPRQAKKQQVDTVDTAGFSDVDDDDYEDLPPLGSRATSTSESDSDDMLPSNAEVCIFLVCYFRPDAGWASGYRLPISFHPRPSLLWGEALPESAHAPSLWFPLWKVKMSAIPIVATRGPTTIAATRMHSIKPKKQLCVFDWILFD